MVKYMKNRFFIIILAALVIFLSSCRKQETKFPICYEIVSAISKSESQLPAGKIYYKNARKGEDGYISQNMLSAVFGGGKELEIFALWDDIALFLPSSEHPCEFIVIHCASFADTTDTALLLSSRLSSLKDSKGDKYPEYFSDSEVYIVKNYVIMIISSDFQNTLSIARGAIKKGS